ncbi:MAG: amino acid adenylation domain-containing protein, partial [Lentisphaeraceae bacterium]|nr:amino acid adenylation domain-containing protein [Lentisphaeraceae bacterium]
MGTQLGDSALVPLRFQFASDETVEQAVERLQKSLINISEYSSISLEEIQKFSEIEATEKLFNILFLNGAGKLSEYHQDYSLIVKFLEGEELEVIYQTSVYGIDILEELALNVENVLREMIANESACLEQISVMNPQSVSEVQKLSKGEVTAQKEQQTLHGLFADQVISTPQNIAVKTSAGKTLTYQQLDVKSSAVALALQEKLGRSLNSKDVIGLYLEKDLPLIYSILAVLKAGASFLNLDPTYPQERLQYMLEDSACALVISSSAIQSLDVEKTLSVEDVNWQKTAYTPVESHVQDAAYHVYTSGTTGKPKAVAIPHQGIVNAFYGWQSVFELNSNDCHLQMAAISFDVFIGDFSRALLSGAQLLLCPKEILVDAEKLVALMQREQVSVAEFVPAVLREVYSYWQDEAQTLNSLKVMVCGSDKWDGGDYRNFRKMISKECRVLNTYGVAEASVDTCYYEIPVEFAETVVPIGRPYENTEIFIVDCFGKLAPQGVLGEICIGGKGLALSYPQLPELTAQKFISFAGQIGQSRRLYRTGDFGRYNDQGFLEFTGRRDDQVKLRGQRIELEEIENQISSHAQVDQALVRVIGENNQAYLAAYYITSSSDFELDELKDYLQEKLAAYMLPAAWIQLEAMPLSANGKVDRKQLPLPDKQFGFFEAPIGEVEIKLAKIWQEVLAVENISRNDDFFMLGGHSLNSLRLLNKINNKFEVKVKLVDLFAKSRFENQAALVSEAVTNQESWSLLSLLKSGENAPPLILIHPAFGGAECYEDLVKKLNYEGPIYGVDNYNLCHYEKRIECSEDLAAFYLSEINKIMGSQKLSLCGWSFGAHLAYEMACQLGEEKVESLFLLEAPVALTDTEEKDYTKEIDYDEHFSLLTKGDDDDYSTLSAEQRKLYVDIDHQTDRMVEMYRAQLFGGHVDFFEAVLDDDDDESMCGTKACDWKAYAADLEVIKLPSTHATMLSNKDSFECIYQHMNAVFNRRELCQK